MTIIHRPARRRDFLNPWLAFRDAGSGLYVSRAYALQHKSTTVSERRRRS